MREDKTRIERAIETANRSGRFFCKFVSANDVGLTNTHQEGIYLANSAWNLFFPGVEKVKGTNIEKLIQIHIDSYYPFVSRLIYYGKGTRNEYRITRLWANSPYEKEQHIGDLVVFIPMDSENFKLYLLDSEEEINEFIEHFSLSLVNNVATYTTEAGQVTGLNRTIEEIIEEEARNFEDFPDTATMAELSRRIYINFNKITGIEPDKHLLKWIETEYSVFRAIERNVYSPYLTEAFGTLDTLLKFASSALNRRKSRAGKSLEHHANYIFSNVPLPFDNPGRTEGKKKPDFLLPSSEDYADMHFSDDKLIFLGAKTTCKDRWRQVLNEANRIPQKHLLTLQQGITANQMDEMHDENLTLVVPAPYHKYYPETHRDRLWTVQRFIDYSKEKYMPRKYMI